MNAPDSLTVVVGCARFCPHGEVSLQTVGALVRSAIVYCREQQIRRLMVNITGLTGFSSPTFIERYRFIQEWAREAAGLVSIALLAPPEMIDPEKFSVLVAANAGLTYEVFTSASKAMAWLLMPKTHTAEPGAA